MRRKGKFFKWNYTFLIVFSFLLILFVPSLLYYFEWVNYTEEKQEATEMMQSKIDEEIFAVKSLLNYTFFDKDFQENLSAAIQEGSQADNDRIYERLTASNILGGTVQSVWFFLANENKELSYGSMVVSSDYLTSFIPNVLETIQTEYYTDAYKAGKYFAFPIKAGLNNDEVKALVIGHQVLGADYDNYLEPIGVCTALINLSSLTDSFSLVDESAVKIGLFNEDGERIYGNTKGTENALQGEAVYKIEIESKYFGFKTILYFDSMKVFYDFLPYLFSIVASIVALSAIFFVYMRAKEKQKSKVFDSFVSTFKEIGQGNFNERIEKYDVEELDLVSEQFNLMMDSLLIFNNALKEEEMKSAILKKEMSLYVLKYLNSQINKHFIFNTFGTIRSLIRLKKKDEAIQCIDSLCGYLRFSFRGRDIVTVADELSALKNYLDIQAIRMPNVLVEMNVDERIFFYKIPQFILQPIVENAYKHAFKRNRGHLTITGGLSESDTIELIIKDDGVGIEAQKVIELNELLKENKEIPQDEHIGIANVQRRLKILTGESAFIKIESEYGMGTMITIRCGNKPIEVEEC